MSIEMGHRYDFDWDVTTAVAQILAHLDAIEEQLAAIRRAAEKLVQEDNPDASTE